MDRWFMENAYKAKFAITEYEPLGGLYFDVPIAYGGFIFFENGVWKEWKTLNPICIGCNLFDPHNGDEKTNQNCESWLCDNGGCPKEKKLYNYAHRYDLPQEI